jgi:hypothetical protein
VDKLCRPLVVCQDAAHLGSSKKHKFRAFFRKKAKNRRLIRQIQLRRVRVAILAQASRSSRLIIAELASPGALPHKL